ncbi:MAG: hypothetical protein IJ150_01965 [Bacteroidales bacterium]|nr:hypothetical protein [Bacteroidales bacterium]
MNNNCFKAFVLIVLAIFSTATLSAQSLSSGQQSFVERRAAQKVGQMNNYIAYMVDEGYSSSDRKYYMQNAKNLFIGMAETYTEEGYSKIVNMQVTSVRNPTTPRTYPVKKYFESLIGLIERGVYDNAKINTTDITDMQVSHLRHLYDNVYECTVAYVQLFCGYKDGRAYYCDRTKKNIKCRVYINPDGNGGYELEVSLSDCHATETKKINSNQINNGGLLIPDR